jgi:GntR family transcriptional regulator
MADPMYRQIAEDLREQIESGQLGSGQQLRTEVELREHYTASRNTVRDAIKLLTALGLVETKPGQGTFVIEKIDPFVTMLSGDPETGRGSDEETRYRSEVGKQNRTADTSRVQVEIQRPTDEIASALRIKRGAEVISRHERRFIDDIPWSMQTSYYPLEFVDRGADRLRSASNIDEGAVQYLADALGIYQKGFRDRIIVRTPNTTEANFFKLPPDGRIAMYEIYRTAFGDDKKPMRVTVTVYPADRNQFIVESGEVPPLDDQSGEGS